MTTTDEDRATFVRVVEALTDKFPSIREAFSTVQRHQPDTFASFAAFTSYRRRDERQAPTTDEVIEDGDHIRREVMELFDELVSHTHNPYTTDPRTGRRGYGIVTVPRVSRNGKKLSI